MWLRKRRPSIAGVFDYLERRSASKSFSADVLDAAEQLDADAQAELGLGPVAARPSAVGKCATAAVMQARREFAAGQCQAMTAAELVREAL